MRSSDSKDTNPGTVSLYPCTLSIKQSWCFVATNVLIIVCCVQGSLHLKRLIFNSVAKIYFSILDNFWGIFLKCFKSDRDEDLYRRIEDTSFALNIS